MYVYLVLISLFLLPPLRLSGQTCVQFPDLPMRDTNLGQVSLSLSLLWGFFSSRCFDDGNSDRVSSLCSFSPIFSSTSSRTAKQNRQQQLYNIIISMKMHEFVIHVRVCKRKVDRPPLNSFLFDCHYYAGNFCKMRFYQGSALIFF